VPGTFSGKSVAVVGMGRSNQALCRYLLREGAKVTCFDRKSREEMGHVYDEFSRFGVGWSLGPGYLEKLPSFRQIFLTPGMKKNQPEIVEARGKGALISTEIGLFLERCKGKVAGITGSAGKTTTASLAYAMLRESLPQRQIYLGGNIGSVLIEKVDEIPEDAVVVLELSSFQLELCTKSPEVALILNIRPNHLDIHESFQDYVDAKSRIYRFQREKDLSILNFDDPVTRGLLAEPRGEVHVYSLEPYRPALFESKVVGRDTAGSASSGPETSGYRNPGSPGAKVRKGAWLSDGRLIVGEFFSGYGAIEVAKEKDFLIPGKHNISNALGAILLSLAAGANLSGIRKAVESFKGIEHRIEFVREIDGVRYYNDSIATSPDRTMALLETLQGPLVIILGGYDKGLPFDGLAQEIVARGCKVITLGKSAPKIEEAIWKAWQESQNRKEKQRGHAGAEGQARQAKKETPEDLEAVEYPFLGRVSSLQEAVYLARECAKPGYSVALSPACASFDMFRDFEERGRIFKDIVVRMR